jgi:signal transduction histidine kinase
MSLGTKINLILVTVTAILLTFAFWIIVSIEAETTKKQVINDAEIASGIFHGEIERMFKQVHDQQVRLQNTVDEISAIDGVNYINVTGVDGYHVATTDHTLIGTKATARDIAFIDEIKKEKKSIDARNDMGSYYEFERRIPIHLVYADPTSDVVNIIEVEVKTISKNGADILAAQKLLRAISASTEQTARSIIVTRNEDLAAIQKITDGVSSLGKINNTDEFGFYHDFVVFDNKLNILANTGHEENEFANDPAEYKQYREDVLVGKIPQASFERIHEGHDVLVGVTPIQFLVDGNNQRVGVMEIHILVSAYKDKIDTLILRMLGIGVVLMAVLVAVLAMVLRREVVNPISRYSKIAQKVADGDLDQKIENTTDDEIGHFGQVFNSMVANLRELDRLKSDFISVAAHQLRTPLSGVKWVLKLVLDGDLGPINEDQKGMLKRGYETNEKMIQLVNDLLNVSRIENGKFGYKIEKNDFIQLLKTLVENTELASGERNIQVLLENRAGDIAPFFFDPEKLLIALQNLVDNAMKYTLPGGRVTISTEHQGDYLQIKVSDTGVGIPKADLPKLFSKFFRAANVIHLQTDGSGLGLFIVKNIIVRHGGQVWVESEEGKGTTFTVVIPLIAELLPKDENAVMPTAEVPVAKA